MQIIKANCDECDVLERMQALYPAAVKARKEIIDFNEKSSCVNSALDEEIKYVVIELSANNTFKKVFSEELANFQDKLENILEAQSLEHLEANRIQKVKEKLRLCIQSRCLLNNHSIPEMEDAIERLNVSSVEYDTLQC